MSAPTMPPAAWYPDPAGSGGQRYWDGTQWTSHVLPPPAPEPVPEPVSQMSFGPGPGSLLPAEAPRRRWSKRLVVPLALLLLWLLVFPPALYAWRKHHQVVDTRGAASVLRARSAAGQPVVTPAQARKVLDVLWPLREQALHAGDVRAVRELESGSAEWADVIRAQNGSSMRRTPGTFSEASVLVPRQQGYPARFLAHVETTIGTGTPWAEVMVFVRPSAGAPWTLDLDTGWTPGSPQAGLLAPVADGQGYAAEPSASVRARAERARRQLADYWTRAKKSGTVPDPGPLAPGTWTTGRAEQLAAHPQGTTQANGLRGHTTVSVPRSPLQSFLAAGGAEVSCGVLWTTSVNTAGPQGYPYQPKDRSNWGQQLSPGVYRQVTTRYQWQTCFVVPLSGGPVRVVGGQGLTEALSTGVRIG